MQHEASSSNVTTAESWDISKETVANLSKQTTTSREDPTFLGSEVPTYRHQRMNRSTNSNRKWPPNKMPWIPCSN